ncbi:MULTISPECIES: hypothetical protein [Chryseobacterium]|uniref:Immunity protein 26 of polymorphic toxin system n=1 Tax=Chryseobacterium geocarposphaerae TaxID=1416776 RepID=A0ABU1LDI1_9FLAO|nr:MULTISPECIES: hypothetical protein [Chryseobacterium]MDR6404610.1 hypothetical protein [Chryseobacterium geocarposphaerae]MDR6698157.1 hypothetical protein [Chryseobacterium ginsenosidimutans]
MGWYYSFGIIVENEKIALEYKREFPQNIILSNSNIVKISSYINKVVDSDHYTIQFSPIGLGTDKAQGRDILFDKPYFYEIRDFFYKELFSLNINFKIALFELEAGDYLGENVVIEELNAKEVHEIAYGFQYISNGDANASNISWKNPPEYYIAKRYLDGLILNKNEFDSLTKNTSEFQLFKENYYWLPIQEFKILN